MAGPKLVARWSKLPRCITATNPILTNALMADYPSNEQSGFFSIIRSARIWDDLEKLGIPGIQGVYAHPAGAGGFGMTVIALEQRYAGHAAQAWLWRLRFPAALTTPSGSSPSTKTSILPTWTK